MMTILILEPENYSNEAVKLYEKLGQVHLETVPEHVTNDIKILVVRLAYNIDKKFLARYPALQTIVTPTTGLTHISLDECDNRNIRVYSLADCRTAIEKVTSTSELTFGLMISLLRKIPMAHSSVVADGLWDRDRFRSRQLSSLTLGIVGLGRLGGHMAKFATAFGMRVMAYDPFQNKEQFAKFGVKRCNLDDLLKQVDILSIHVNYMPDNHNLIGQKEIALLASHAMILNTARGALLDEHAAAQALKNGELGGIAVDVLADEHSARPFNNSPLIKAANSGLNVIVTPHIGGCTSDAMHITELHLAEHVINSLENTS